MTAENIPLLVIGSTGRIGRVLRHCWADRPPEGTEPIWQARDRASGSLNWDILAEPCPAGAASGVVLCLAGVIRGTSEQLALNTALALAACRAAKAQGARHVFLTSSAAVYGPDPLPLAESERPKPQAAYGAAKADMEQAVLRWQDSGRPGLTILRIGNIAGLDALLGSARPGQPVRLDPVPGQTGGPMRSYVGPVTLSFDLARLVELAAEGKALPPVLNVAASPAVSMAALLDAAGLDWSYVPPNPAVIPCVELDTTLLKGLVTLPASAGQAEAMVAEWRGLN